MDKFKPGVYRLRDKFVSTKPDKRKSGWGWRTPGGLPKNAVIVVQPWWGNKEGAIEVVAPQYLYAHEGLVLHPMPASPVGYGSAQGPDKAIDTDLARLAGLLEPVDLGQDHEAWLVSVCNRKHFGNRHEEILVELLRLGYVTQVSVANTLAAIEARDKAEHPE